MVHLSQNEPRTSDRRRYKCPFCTDFKGGTATSLVKHCLEERENTVEFVCSNCACSKDPHTVHKLYTQSHRCYAKGYSFHARQMKRSLQEVKEILNKQRGVAPEMVDRLAKAALVRRKHRKIEEGTQRAMGE